MSSTSASAWLVKQTSTPIGRPSSLAAAVVLQARAQDLLAVEQILRPDEADHAVDQQRLEAPRDGIGAALQRLLIAAVVGAAGQRAALAGLEVHDLSRPPRLSAHRAAAQGLLRLRSSSASVMPKPRLAASVPAMDWNTRSTGAPRLMASSVVVTCVSTQLCVGISWRAMTGVQHLQQAHDLRQVVGRGVDADDGVARAHQQAVEQAGGDAGLVVRRVVGLQPRRQPPALADRAAKPRDASRQRRARSASGPAAGTAW